MVTPADAEFELHLPKGSAEQFLAGMASIPPEKWVSWRRHRVEEGDTLGAIAKKYRTEVKAIAAANELEPGAPLRAGEKLIIPAAAAMPVRLGQLVRYKVRRGDTLPSIADQYSVTPADLRRWNNLRGDNPTRGVSLRIYPGGRPQMSARGGRAVASATRSRSKTLAVGASAAAPVSQNAIQNDTAQPTIHLVQAGETLWSIARAYQTTVEALRRANQFLGNRQVRPGDQVRVQPRK
jgi:membrane-bound lytic murein transglycosylase D